MKLKEYRTKRGFSQQDLARLLDVSPSIISYWESGERTPRLSMVWRICQTLSVSIYDLFLDEISPLDDILSNETSSVDTSSLDTLDK